VKTGSCDRADLLMAAGFSTLTCAFLVLVAPRVGIVFFEILAGLYLVGRSFVVRARLRRARADVRESVTEGSVETHGRFLGRYELVLIILVIVIHSSISGFLRSRGLTESLGRVLPLVLIALGLLLKPRVLRWMETRGRRSRPASSGGDL